MKIAGVVLGLVLSGAFATAQAVPPANGTPSRPVAGTHVCNDYPEVARSHSETGVAYVSYDVEVDGTITHVHIVKSSGIAALDATAVRCVSENWRNSPATQDGIPVASRNHKAAIQFKLLEPSPSPRPAVRIGGAIYALLGVLVLVVVAASIFWFFWRRRDGLRGSVICGKCGTIHIVPKGARPPSRCGHCGQPFNV